MPPDFRNLVSSAAFTVSQILTSLVMAVNLFVLASMTKLLVHYAMGEEPQVSSVVRELFLHPLWLLLIALLALNCWRRITKRLLMDKVRND